MKSFCHMESSGLCVRIIVLNLFFLFPVFFILMPHLYLLHTVVKKCVNVSPRLVTSKTKTMSYQCRQKNLCCRPVVLWSPRHLCSDKRTTHVQWWTIAFILLSSSNSLLVRPQLLPAPTTVAPPPTVNSQWVGLAFTNNTHNRFKSSNNSSSSNRVCWEGPCTRYSVGGLFYSQKIIAITFFHVQFFWLLVHWGAL